ncbi:MAG: hypothetical protein EOM24_26940 [Chloroflexia bacterium]|nr:hypothetical protein [Chloroflexia bacterium]
MLSHDLATSTLTVALHHLSEFALFAQPVDDRTRIWLPVIAHDTDEGSARVQPTSRLARR